MSDFDAEPLAPLDAHAARISDRFPDEFDADLKDFRGRIHAQLPLHPIELKSNHAVHGEITLRIRLVSSFILAAILMIAAAAVAPRTSPAQSENQNPQIIEMTAKKYEYDPGVVHAKVGTKVVLKIRALDRAHGIKVSNFPDGSGGKGDPGLVFMDYQPSGWKLDKDQTTTIEFVAKQAGTYTFRCSVFCGFGHKGMKGQIVVEP